MTVQIHHVGGRKLATMDTDNPKRCRQRIAGDTSWCETCGRQWGTNDYPGPPCPRYGEHDELISLVEQGPKTFILSRDEYLGLLRDRKNARDAAKRDRPGAAMLIGMLLGSLAGATVPLVLSIFGG